MRNLLLGFGHGLTMTTAPITRCALEPGVNRDEYTIERQC
jgi:hypothetical protein